MKSGVVERPSLPFYGMLAYGGGLSYKLLGHIFQITSGTFVVTADGGSPSPLILAGVPQGGRRMYGHLCSLIYTLV